MSSGEAPTLISFVLGFGVSVAASIMNAAGLNLLNLDHIKNMKRPARSQRNECGRPLWHLGLYLYILSQLVGSTVALYFLKAQWVAPLGSISLIFNFIFARALVGTRITKQDIIGTLVVIASVIWIVIFGGMNSVDGDDNLTIDYLKTLFMRPIFILYFSILDFITFGLFCVALYCYWYGKKENRRLSHSFFRNIDALRLKKAVGMAMAGVGGLTASQTLLLAKSGVKLLSQSLGGDSQFDDSLSWFIVVFLIITAILQVYCLNTALKLYDSVLVVPLFYGLYTAMGLLNSMIYLDELNSYPPWALFLVMLGIGVLVYGVLLLSKSKESPAAKESSMSVNTWADFSAIDQKNVAEPEMEMSGNYKLSQIPPAKRASQDHYSTSQAFKKAGLLKSIWSKKSSTNTKYSQPHLQSSGNDLEISENSIQNIIIDGETSDDDASTSDPYSNSNSNSTNTNTYNLIQCGDVSLNDTSPASKPSLSKGSDKDELESISIIDLRIFDDLLSVDKRSEAD